MFFPTNDPPDCRQLFLVCRLEATRVTLIAGFHSWYVSSYWDFLITKNGDVSGLRKKILLVADNCALAWTGYLVAANSVVTRLQIALGQEVTTILTNPSTTSDMGSSHVTRICWVVDAQRAHCFRWRSDYPSNTSTTFCTSGLHRNWTEPESMYAAIFTARFTNMHTATSPPCTPSIRA